MLNVAGQTKQKLALVLTIFVTLWLGSGCESKLPPPAKPCELGVNANSCSTTIAEATSWATKITYTHNPSGTGGKSPTVKNIITRYEFKPSPSGPIWRRSITEDSDGGRRSMYQAGEVIGIDGGAISLRISSSSCLENGNSKLKTPRDFSLYYRRSPNTLVTQMEPFKAEEKASNLFDALAIAIVQRPMEAMLEATKEAFTFGLQNSLESGKGNFTLETSLAAEAFGDIGCFTSVTNTFETNKLGSDW